MHIYSEKRYKFLKWFLLLKLWMRLTLLKWLKWRKFYFLLENGGSNIFMPICESTIYFPLLWCKTDSTYLSEAIRALKISMCTRLRSTSWVPAWYAVQLIISFLQYFDKFCQKYLNWLAPQFPIETFRIQIVTPKYQYIKKIFQ